MKDSNARIMRKLKATIVRDLPRRAGAKAVLIEIAVAVLTVIFVSCANHDPVTEHRATPHDDSPIGRAFASGTSDVQVEGEGTVISILRTMWLGHDTSDSSFSLHQGRRC